MLVGAGVSLTIRASLGVAPYDVLITGLAGIAGVPIGVAALAASLAFMAAGAALGGRIGPGTVMAAAAVGPAVQLGLELAPPVEALALRLAMFALGSLAIACGITLVVLAELGPGPVELVMLALQGRGHGLVPARTAIELGSVCAGWAMGGQLGVGTVVFALAIGPSLRLLLERAGYRGPAPDAAKAAAPGA